VGTTVTMYDIDLDRPMGSWRKGWREACKRAGVSYRWHDLRHTFVTRLAEHPDVSEQTNRALAGHVSNQMLHHYSHIRSQAKQAPIHTLEDHASEPFCRSMGKESGKVVGKLSAKQRLSYWKQMVGPVGFEPTTNGIF
jgi:hypothetical protein